MNENENKSKGKRSVVTIVAAVLCVICAVVLVVALSSRAQHAKPLDKDPNGDIAAQEQQGKTVDVPVDFAAWQARNPDVYAWIEYPGTNVDYPILQREGDDAYYLRRDIDGNEAVAGSLYTEWTYNTKTFDDPVTVIYGHNMADRTMFGGLQSRMEAADLTGTEEYFYIYLPERVLKYRVIGGTPSDDAHILYYHDFTDASVFNQYFGQLYGQSNEHVNLPSILRPGTEDKVVILATCMNGETYYRYLILGVLVDDSAAS